MSRTRPLASHAAVHDGVGVSIDMSGRICARHSSRCAMSPPARGDPREDLRQLVAIGAGSLCARDALATRMQPCVRRVR